MPVAHFNEMKHLRHISISTQIDASKFFLFFNGLFLSLPLPLYIYLYLSRNYTLIMFKQLCMFHVYESALQNFHSFVQLNLSMNSELRYKMLNV